MLPHPDRTIERTIFSFVHIFFPNNPGAQWFNQHSVVFPDYEFRAMLYLGVLNFSGMKKHVIWMFILLITTMGVSAQGDDLRDGIDRKKISFEWPQGQWLNAPDGFNPSGPEYIVHKLHSQQAAFTGKNLRSLSEVNIRFRIAVSGRTGCPNKYLGQSC